MFGRFALMAVAVSATLLVGGCSDGQLARFTSGVKNLVAGVHVVDEALKDVNATIYSNCQDLVATANAINDLTGQCSAAAPYTSTANAIVDQYCQSSEIAANGGIAKTSSIVAKSVSAAKSTLTANKAACANGAS